MTSAELLPLPTCATISFACHQGQKILSAIRHFEKPIEHCSRSTLEQTYVGTFDCPELNGIRTTDEIVTGHTSQGQHDPDRWWLAFAGDVPVGVLLLTAIPEWRGWDLSYLGVVSTARRQGLAEPWHTSAFRNSTSWAKQVDFIG